MIDPADADMVVAAFTDAIATEVDPIKTLREWSVRHPELEADFAAVAVERQLGDERVEATESEAVNSQADMMTRMLGEMAGKWQARPAMAPAAAAGTRPSSVKEAAESRGLAYPAELARRLRLPENILDRIVSRRIDPASIPAALVQQIAATLQASRDDVLMWLRSPLAGTAGTPALVREEAGAYRTSTSFADAIANASEVDEADRAYWQSILRVSRVVADDD